MEAVWDGVTQPEVLSQGNLQTRQELANAAKHYEWSHVDKIIGEHPELVNTTRPGGTSLFAPLHQAAHGGAPIAVIQRLVERGAWRTLQNSRGERPVDVAERRGNAYLLDVLAPQFGHRIPHGIVMKIQSHFHAVILGRAERLVRDQRLRLPELEPLLEPNMHQLWFPIPGMAGGFSFHFKRHGVEAVLVSESWCRTLGGSGQRHEITSAGSRLVQEGFV